MKIKIKEILEFIFHELKTAISEKNTERISDLGTTTDILYEASKKYRDIQIMVVLEKIDYVVFHYNDEFSFTADYLKEIEQLIGIMESR